jgi:16S rRNA (cytosine1402-N4)-methyltransferase
VAEAQHLSVLKEEVLRAFLPFDSERPRELYFLDGTLGLGGHASALLEAAGAGAFLIGFDKDPEARSLAAQALQSFGSRVRIVASGFEDMKVPAREFLGGRPGYHGILLDLGVSSLQLDSAARGFSFRSDAPLDMRMDPTRGLSAAGWLQRQDEKSLADALYQYGEERRSRAIARSILKAKPKRTLELADAVLRIGWPHQETHPATRTFQAIRIAVNGELEALESALPQALALLAPGGRLAVISFHSLEDRIVKTFIQRESSECLCPPGLPECRCGHKASLRKVSKKAIVANDKEINENPRARSAKLRIAEALPLGPESSGTKS